MEVQAEDVYFRYPEMENDILSNLNMHVQPGEKWMITGSNGSGKSTLLNILAALYQPQKGSISFDKLPVGNLEVGSLRHQIGAFLNQEMLFMGTLAENISLGRENVHFDDIKWAAEMMGLTDFVRSADKGYDTLIDPEGRKLPRSTVQKILLARAVVNKPRLLLLEDPMEYIEESEQQRIIDALTHHDSTWTMIAVSHHDYLGQRCHRVLHMEKGKII